MPNFEDVTVKIQPSATSGVDLLPDVLRQLNAMVRLLTDFAARNSKVEVVEISKRSPLMAVLRVVHIDEAPKAREAATRKQKIHRTAQPFRRLEKVYDEVSRERPSKQVDATGLIALQDFAKQLRSDIATIETSKSQMVVSSATVEQIQNRLGQVHRSRGTLTGILEGLNVHSKPWSFTIYPEVGPSRVKCTFNEDQFAEVQKAIRKIVSVHGLKDYVVGSPWPVKIAVDRIEIREEAEPGAWLTLVDNLQGVWDEAEEDERLMILEGMS